MFQSEMTKSTFSRCIRCNAAAPSSASTMLLYPNCRSMLLMMRRIVEKSSTVRIFMFWSAIVCFLLHVFAPLPSPRPALDPIQGLFLEEHFELATEMKDGLRMNL